jgi:hypothetical protein
MRLIKSGGSIIGWFLRALGRGFWLQAFEMLAFGYRLFVTGFRLWEEALGF